MLEEFKPRNQNEVKIFTCGPSVYRRPHIGNYRTFLYEDLLVRYLEYKKFTVNRVINYTDVEDKTIEEADGLGLTADELTAKVKDTFRKEAELLHIKLPDFIPSSASSVDAAAGIIRQLMDKGYAYRYDGNIFFDPLKKKDFGKLAHLDMSKWPKNKVRFKKDTYPGTRWNRGDFILWHGSDETGDVAWDTEIGRGRPSWNVQDPAMIYKHLGLEIDINCGGIDNIVRHHDYNIAIIEALSGREFAKYYMHGEHLFVEGKKMSKSLGNIYYPMELVADGYDARQIRHFLISTHYRKKLNYTVKAYEKSCSKLTQLADKIAKLETLSLNPKGAPGNAGDISAGIIRALFEAHMDNDLNAGAFLDELDPALSALLNDSHFSAAEADMILHELKAANEVLQVLSFRSR